MARRRKPDPDEELDPDQLEELEAEGALDARGLLRDGARLHVPLYLKDGSTNPYLSATQRAIAAAKTAQQQTQDAVARGFGLTDALQLHRPGFRRNSDSAALERSRRAYQDAEAADRDAWRNPTPRLDYSEHTGSDPSRTGAGAPAKGSNAPAGSYPYSAAAEGAPCSVDGSPGTLVREGNSLVCKPRQRQDAMGLDPKQVAYDEYDRIASNAWRGR